jgi:hypothetical protein
LLHIAASQQLGELRSLDLSHVSISDRAAFALAESAGLEAIKTFILHYVEISQAAATMLIDRFGKAVVYERRINAQNPSYQTCHGTYYRDVVNWWKS